MRSACSEAEELLSRLKQQLAPQTKGWDSHGSFLPSFLGLPTQGLARTPQTHTGSRVWATLTPTAAPCPKDSGTQRVQNPCRPGSLPSHTSRAFPLLSLPLFSFLALGQSPKARLRPVEASPAREWGGVCRAGALGCLAQPQESGGLREVSPQPSW